MRASISSEWGLNLKERSTRRNTNFILRSGMWGCFAWEGENYNEDNEFLRYAAKAVREELVDTNRLANWLFNCDEHHGGGYALVENLTDLFPLPTFAHFESSFHVVNVQNRHSARDTPVCGLTYVRGI